MTEAEDRREVLQAAGRWPVNLPRNYEELNRDFGRFIASLCYKYSKVDRDPRDVINHIWEKILAADLLTKYVDATADDPPSTVTSEEVASFLGVSYEDFQEYLRSAGCRLGDPIQGKRNAKDAVWSMVEIISLSTEEGCFHKQGAITVPPPVVSKEHFMGYLQRSVLNHFINFCRTRTRREKERLGDCFFPPVPSDRDSSPSWEDRVSRNGAEQIEDGAELRIMISRVQEVAPGFERDIFTLVTEGYSLREAVEKTEFLTARDRRLVMRALNLA